MRTGGKYDADCVLTFDSPLGPISAGEREGYLVFLSFTDEGGDCESAPLRDAEHELMEYFHGNLMEFTVPLRPQGTEYQRKVWDAALKIPYGEVRTYGWVSGIAGGSPRSAGNALGANPIPIIIPCHRVIRADGSIGGFSSGMEIKRTLMDMERLHLGESVLK